MSNSAALNQSTDTAGHAASPGQSIADLCKPARMLAYRWYVPKLFEGMHTARHSSSPLQGDV